MRERLCAPVRPPTSARGVRSECLLLDFIRSSAHLAAEFGTIRLPPFWSPTQTIQFCVPAVAHRVSAMSHASTLFNRNDVAASITVHLNTVDACDIADTLLMGYCWRAKL